MLLSTAPTESQGLEFHYEIPISTFAIYGTPSLASHALDVAALTDLQRSEWLPSSWWLSPATARRVLQTHALLGTPRRLDAPAQLGALINIVRFTTSLQEEKRTA